MSRRILSLPGGLRSAADGRGDGLIAGLLEEGRVNGPPCSVLRKGCDAFLFTSDKSGVIDYRESQH